MAGTTTVAVMPSIWSPAIWRNLLHVPGGIAHAFQAAGLEDHVGDDAVDAVLHLLVNPAITLLTTIIVATPSVTLMIDARAI